MSDFIHFDDKETGRIANVKFRLAECGAAALIGSVISLLVIHDPVIAIAAIALTPLAFVARWVIGAMLPNLSVEPEQTTTPELGPADHELQRRITAQNIQEQAFLAQVGEYKPE